MYIWVSTIYKFVEEGVNIICWLIIWNRDDKLGANDYTASGHRHHKGYISQSKNENENENICTTSQWKVWHFGKNFMKNLPFLFFSVNVHSVNFFMDLKAHEIF